ncbi:hypothetical protein ABTO49_21165, partial [Acinetobacter baumannii]
VYSNDSQVPMSRMETPVVGRLSNDREMGSVLSAQTEPVHANGSAAISEKNMKADGKMATTKSDRWWRKMIRRLRHMRKLIRTQSHHV